MLTLFQVTLASAAFLCSLVAGFLFAFAIVVMPGIRRLDDARFIRAFQVMDRVIQGNHPLFVIVWAGSVLALLAAAAIGIWAADGAGRALVLVAALLYLASVQLPTFAVNVPLNNRLQKVDPSGVEEASLRRAREAFEVRWIRWNAIRTAGASLVSLLLLVALMRAA
jgi:uncharacterized membrane protein